MRGIISKAKRHRTDCEQPTSSQGSVWKFHLRFSPPQMWNRLLFSSLKGKLFLTPTRDCTCHAQLKKEGWFFLLHSPPGNTFPWSLARVIQAEVKLGHLIFGYLTLLVNKVSFTTRRRKISGTYLALGTNYQNHKICQIKRLMYSYQLTEETEAQ